MRKLETQVQGRRFAVDVLRKLRSSDPERCRANLPPGCVHQVDAMHKALAELKERATVEACAGFAAILTDLIGTRCQEPMPELYEGMERCGKIRPYRLQRLVNDGHRLASLAIDRQQRGIIESGHPAPFQGTGALTATATVPPDREQPKG